MNHIDAMTTLAAAAGHEVVINAARLGVLDSGRLRSLTDEAATAGMDEASETIEGGRL